MHERAIDDEETNPERTFGTPGRLAGVSRDTINRLSAKTASQAFEETLPHSDKPLQLLTTGEHSVDSWGIVQPSVECRTAGHGQAWDDLLAA